MPTKDALTIVFDELKAKNADYTTKFDYYDGNQPLKYSMDRIARAFDDFNTYFAENWMSVIVQSVLDRLILKGLTLKGDSELETLFNTLHISLDAQDAHEAALITHESFIIVDVIDGQKQLYYNDPRMVMVYYNPDNPKEKLFAGKLWVAQDGLKHITIYFPDRIEDYVSKEGQTARSFRLDSTQPNELRGIPVFHFRTSRRTNVGLLDKSTLSLQDAVNKLFSDMLVAAEFDAFKLRVFLTKADPGDITISPDMYIHIPPDEKGNPGNVLELGGATLTNFIEPLDSIANAIAATTRTPKHYFFSAGDVPSGDALNTMEAPLVKKTALIQESFSVTWQELGAFLMNIDGGNVKPEDITPVWLPIETVQPLQQAQIMQTYKSAGVPLRVAAKKVGWDETEISELPVKDPAPTTVTQNTNNSGAIPQ